MDDGDKIDAFFFQARAAGDACSNIFAFAGQFMQGSFNLFGFSLCVVDESMIIFLEYMTGQFLQDAWRDSDVFASVQAVVDMLSMSLERCCSSSNKLIRSAIF